MYLCLAFLELINYFSSEKFDPLKKKNRKKNKNKKDLNIGQLYRSSENESMSLRPIRIIDRSHPARPNILNLEKIYSWKKHKT